jgi:membrane protein implicated in regulation of membrane protease activity
MVKLLRDYGLSFALGALFLVSLGAQWLTHDGSSTEFLNAVMENWQSEFLQVLAFVVLATYLIHKGSPQSRDSQDRTEAKVDRILAAVERDASGGSYSGRSRGSEAA